MLIGGGYLVSSPEPSIPQFLPVKNRYRNGSGKRPKTMKVKSVPGKDFPEAALGALDAEARPTLGKICPRVRSLIVSENDEGKVFTG